MKNCYLQVLGINHRRFVGIVKSEGKAYDFYEMNLEGHRPPQNKEEIENCYHVARIYYNGCTQHTGAFGVATATAEQIRQYAEENAERILYESED